MDGVSLLAEARAVGLVVAVDGEQLKIRGPKSAAAVARRIMENQSLIFSALAGPTGPPSVDAHTNPAGAADNAKPPPVVPRDDWPGVHVSESAPGSLEPLDFAIAADIATRHTYGEIVGRVARLTSAAARPNATPLNLVVLDDWRAILAAKGDMS